MQAMLMIPRATGHNKSLVKAFNRRSQEMLRMVPHKLYKKKLKQIFCLSNPDTNTSISLVNCKVTN